MIARPDPSELTMILSACGSSGGGTSKTPATDTTTPEPVATDVGEPIGTAASKIIGASGGELSSPDGRLMISIPAGAMANDTEISIQPITNTAHGGKGNGFSLTPDGTTFQQPVSLTFTYTDDDLVGTAPEALGIAFQTAEGYWQLADNVTVDTEAKTITTTTTHFSSWSFVEHFRLSPSKATVKVNDALLLQVEYCYEIEGDRDPKTYERPVLGWNCGPMDQGVASNMLSDWSVNDIPGGSEKWGFLEDRAGRGGYTAPSTKPDPSTVKVSVKIKDLVTKKRFPLVSNVTIVEGSVLHVTADYFDPYYSTYYYDIKDSVDFDLQIKLLEKGGGEGEVMQVTDRPTIYTSRFTKQCPGDHEIGQYEYFSYANTNKVYVSYVPAVIMPPDVTLPPGWTLPEEKKDVHVVLNGKETRPGVYREGHSGEGGYCGDEEPYIREATSDNQYSIDLSFSFKDLNKPGDSFVQDKRDSHGTGWRYTITYIE